MSWKDLGRHMGERATVIGPVRDVTYRSDINGQPTWINLGRAFPNRNRVNLVIWGRNRVPFVPLLRRIRTGDEVCATAEVSNYRGVVQIELQSPYQLDLQ